MFRQITSFMDCYLSKQQCGFKKGYSPQYCLLVMLEKWKNAVNKEKCFGALLTDLSKTFDCLSHELLIAKLHVCGFNLSALKRIQVTYQTENNAPKLMQRIAHRKKFCLEYYKDLLWVPYYSMFFCVICFG